MSTSMLDGKVGRIYMPRQDFESLALRKMKVRCSSHRGHSQVFILRCLACTGAATWGRIVQPAR